MQVDASLLGSISPQHLLKVLSEAALPLMILVLGMQLERAVWPARPSATVCAVVVSLVVAPLVAIGLASVLDVAGPARQATMTLNFEHEICAPPRSGLTAST